jgi:hypothetical protein
MITPAQRLSSGSQFKTISCPQLAPYLTDAANRSPANRSLEWGGPDHLDPASGKSVHDLLLEALLRLEGFLLGGSVDKIRQAELQEIQVERRGRAIGHLLSSVRQED